MQFFHQLDAILAVRDATRPPQVLESSGSLEADSEPEEEEEVTDNADSPDVESSDASQGQMQSVETEVSTPSLSISSATSVTSEVPDEEASTRADGTSAAEGPTSKKIERANRSQVMWRFAGCAARRCQQKVATPPNLFSHLRVHHPLQHTELKKVSSAVSGKAGESSKMAKVSSGQMSLLSVLLPA